MSKDNIPVSSLIMRAIITENYAEAIKIITADDFDPNARTKAWNAPLLSAMINILTDLNGIEDKQNLKEVFKAIVAHEKFDPNLVDSEGETILMHIARKPEFNWLAPFILLKKNIDLTIKNFMKRDVFTISILKKNKVLSDILLSYKGAHIKGMPHKRVGIKPIVKATETVVQPTVVKEKSVVDKIEYAFEDAQKNNPVSLYWVLHFFLTGEYDQCLKIVKDIHFDPNETDRWEEPSLTSLIYYSQDKRVNYDEEKFKEIADAIINNRKFDINALDADCNTPIMVSMGYKNLQWLTKKLFDISSTRIDVVNDEGENLRDIAGYSGNLSFYESLIRGVPEVVETK